MRRIQLFLVNASILTATSLLMSGTGVWFNLYVAEKLGAQGMGLYQLILSVYSFAVTLASSGIHLAATRLVAEENAQGGQGRVHGAMRRCVGFSFCFGVAAAGLLFFGAPFIGREWLSNAQTIRPLQVMAMSMPLLAVSCAFSGYFTAVRRVAKASAAQIFEQFAKIILTVSVLTALVPDTLEGACLAITGSGVVCETLSFLLEFILYKLDSRRYPRDSASSRGLLKKLCHVALPMACSSYLRSGLMTVKNLMVPHRLQAGGLSSGAALSMFGAVHGVALPVILFPAGLLNSFSSLIVPEMAQAQHKKQQIDRIIRKMFTLNISVSMGVCGILFSFASEIGSAVSQNPDVGVYIRLLAPVIPVMYLDTAVDCMLKGLDEQVSVMRYNVYDAFLSLVFVWAVLPPLGIKGYVLMIVLSEVFNFALSFRRLVMVTSCHIDPVEQIALPLLCAAVACIGVHTCFMRGLFPRYGVFGTAFLLIVLTGGIYFALLLFSGALRPLRYSSRIRP